MDDLDRMLAESMRGAAGRAPSDAGLLGTVHARSRRHRRRRIAAGLTTVAAALAVGVPFAAVRMTGPDQGAPPPAAAPVSPVPSPSGANPVTLTEGWAAPVFPYTIAPTDGMREPRASLERGNPIGFFEATELREHADVTITVSRGKPAEEPEAEEQAMTVRGHAGTLRTVDVEPVARLTLVWRETADRWIQLATDDTYTPQEVVAIAESMTAASIEVLPPFALGLSPAGLVTDSVTASTMSFRTPDAPQGTAAVTVVLRKQRPLTGANEQVGRYAAALTRDAGGATLAVDVTDWQATLEVTVTGGLTISDADLLRFAAGVRILNRSDPE